MTLDRIDRAARRHGLFVMGACHWPGENTSVVVLVGTRADFWSYFENAPEQHDGQPDPLDRWSRRIIPELCPEASSLYPSDGPPYAPFIAMALKTGRFFESPVGMMVHDTAGLMISIRGALILPETIALPDPAAHPCHTCPDKPCLEACPVGALSRGAPYDVSKCKAYLSTHAGASCMSGGCLVRRACPVSQRFARDPAQSGFHMQAFMGEDS